MPHLTIDKLLELRERPPRRTPVMYQKWRDLLFLHWAFDPETIQATLPQDLYVDTFASRAYVGIVPFFMRDVRPRGLPTVPGISNFLELNLRTYAHDRQGIPGVWFYSLDANQWLAVEIAKKFFGLPYHYAEMRASKNDQGEIKFSSQRRAAGSDSRSTFRYRPHGPIRYAQPGSLEFFLMERYLLFSQNSKGGKRLTGRVHHHPYPLLDVEVAEWDTKLFELNSFQAPECPPEHIVMSKGVDVEVFGLTYKNR
jgi:uncharacterized protein YqjF (DUF2071 family)